MKFLAIDTSGKNLAVVAVNGERVEVRDLACAMQHSVRLMEEIDGALRAVSLLPKDCDFFACVVGPGSFTGIRIGISAVKGLCLATDRPALAVTSFEALAYAEGSGKTLALVDAGHDCYYACPFEEKTPVSQAEYLSRERAEAWIFQGHMPISCEKLGLESRIVSPAQGLLQFALTNANRAAPASELKALYLRKSSAEEKR